jgi:glutathione synthase/RimK-type ligase-like ATP-grasp enzyme
VKQEKLAIGPATDMVKTRMGVSRLTKLAFEGVDLGGVWQDLLDSTFDQPGNPATIMDLSVVAQLLGDPDSGAKLQDGALALERVYRLPTAEGKPRLRLLAIAGATDIGGNIPIGFLVDGSDVEVLMLYVIPDQPLPDPLPDHDVALVTLGNSDSMTATLEALKDMESVWPRPFLNSPENILRLERDRFCDLMKDASHIELPKTARVTRESLVALARNECDVTSLVSDGAFPIILRPVNSHAGRGLARIADRSGIDAYLAEQDGDDFFISRFVDYSGPDCLYRKYRVVFIGGRPYAVHMAIAEDWKVWYLNANMDSDEAKRAEEACFMQNFDQDFATRHAAAFAELTERVDLDYFGIDCAETKDGRLLVFEAETALIVHDMDPPDIYPYKVEPMRKLFAGFVAMLHRRATSARTEAA